MYAYNVMTCNLMLCYARQCNVMKCIMYMYMYICMYM